MASTDHQHFPKGLDSFTVYNDVLPAFLANDGSFFAPYVPKEIFPFDTWTSIIPTEDDNEDENLSPFLSWEKVQNHISTHTSHYDDAGTKFPKIGALNRLANHAFGLPVTINMYISPIGLSKSLPLHTDPQDIFIFQTQGVKHWHVFHPPPTKVNVDPYNRGKNGDIIQSHEIPNEPLIDTILCPGDVLYIPAGFPHTADTIIVSEDYESICGKKKKDILGGSDHSLHLTIGIETHHWALTYAHLRYSLLTKSQLKNDHLSVENEAHWKSMDTLNVGFLANHNEIYTDDEPTIGSRKTNIRDDTFLCMDILQNLKYIMRQLEPTRWGQEPETELIMNNIDSEKTSGKSSDKEEMPSTEKFEELVDFVIDSHLPTIMVLQNHMNKITDEMDKHELLVRIKRIRSIQYYIMKEYWTFSDDKYMMAYYTD